MSTKCFFFFKFGGCVSEAEIAQTEALFHQLRLNAAQRQSAIEHFKKGATAGFDPGPTVTQFNDCLGPRRQAQHTLMIFLVGIALADGNFSSAERTAIFRLSACSVAPTTSCSSLASAKCWIPAS